MFQNKMGNFDISFEKKNSTINQVVKISHDISLTLLNKTIYIESKMLTCKLTCMQLKDIERLTNIELKYSCYRRDQQSSSVSITFISQFPYEVFKSTHIIWASKIL